MEHARNLPYVFTNSELINVSMSDRENDMETIMFRVLLFPSLSLHIHNSNIMLNMFIIPQLP